MRLLLLCLIAVSLLLVGAGCGSSSSTAVPNPLANELSYFPSGSPFVGVIATDPQGAAVQNALGLLGAFPLSSLGIAAVESQLSSLGVNYQSDIEPLYGNPLAVGVLQVPGAASHFLAVWTAKSAAKLDALVKKLHGLTPAGTLDGATVYHAGGSATVAVEGATAVFGASAADVDAALSRHAHGSGGITSATFSSAMRNLPQNTFMQAFGSLTGTLSTSSSAGARDVPWVAAIRSYAAAISVDSAGIHGQFRIDTSGGSLATSRLPIAAGTTAPSLAGTLPIAVGARDPGQIISFGEAALQAGDPTDYAKFVREENAVKRKTGYDLSTFAALLAGNSVIESDTKTTMARADVSDPASAAKQLAALGPVLRDLFPAAEALAKQPSGFYAIKQARASTINLGLVGNEFVAGAATPAQLRAFATAPTTPVANAAGSLTFRISVIELVMIALKTSPGSIVRTLLSSLGNVTGSAGASPSALTGSISLGVK